ncbi:hypothetical protein [Rhodopila sp.]|uniref:hypothetical protein n=1 Tax=Rhodopila sp. TaxID=2480087 RepID=UPI003D0FF2E7
MQTTLTAGVNLGKAGQAAAGQAGQAAVLSSDASSGFKRAEIFRRTYKPTSDAAVSGKPRDPLSGIQTKLDARAQVLHALAIAYGALGSLWRVDRIYLGIRHPGQRRQSLSD